MTNGNWIFPDTNVGYTVHKIK